MEDVFSESRKQAFSRGEAVPTQENVHFIVDGYVGLYVEAEHTKRLLFVYKKGEVIPMMDSDGQPEGERYVYIAMKRVHTLAKPFEMFYQAMEDPTFAQTMLTYTRHISELQFERINNMQHPQVLTRLVERLLFFEKRLGVKDGRKIRLDVPLSHVDIATSIGATRETVNRYMRQLEDKGILTVRRQRITINSPDELRALVRKNKGMKPNWALLSTLVAGTILTQVI